MPEHPISKENLDQYLKELAKEYRKQVGKAMPAEIILIGGASVLINYGFRETTYDMDVIINAASAMKDAITKVGDKFSLPYGWINEDFKKTSSYSPSIRQYATYYRTFSNTVTCRTVTGKYLVAMKLMAGRQYKYDRSDVIGVLMEEADAGSPLSMDDIRQAASDLYGSYDAIPETSRSFIEPVMENGDYRKLYDITRRAEAENKEILIEYQEDHPKVINQGNVNDVLAALRKRKQNL